MNDVVKFKFTWAVCSEHVDGILLSSEIEVRFSPNVQINGRTMQVLPRVQRRRWSIWKRLRDGRA